MDMALVQCPTTIPTDADGLLRKSTFLLSSVYSYLSVTVEQDFFLSGKELQGLSMSCMQTPSRSQQGLPNL